MKYQLGVNSVVRKGVKGHVMANSPNDFNAFQKFNKTLPDNLRDDNYKYGDYSKYDLYGMWEAVGKPKSFVDVKDTEYFPLQEDGTYHGFSVGNEGVWLKPKSHPSAWMEYSSGALSPELKNMTVVQREDGRLQYVPKTYMKKQGVSVLNAGGEKHKIYIKSTNRGKGAKGHIMVNHPTIDKGKWDTIDLTEKAGAKTVEEGKAATRKWHRENPYISGAKSVKQYRGDENLPEAKKGMKRTYKYQDGNRAALIKSLEKKHLGDIYETERNKEGMDLPGRDYWEMKFRDQLNTSDAAKLYENIIKKQQLMGVKDRIYKSPNPLVSPDQRVNIEPPMPPSNINPKTLNVDKKISDKELFGIDEGMYNKKGSKSLKSCGCKHPKAKYKYGTGALTIPEGSAIVTANGGKNKQALMAYKQGNYKLLNKIIDEMPEDKVDKKQNGDRNIEALKRKYPWFKPFTQAKSPGGATSRTTGKTTTLDSANEESDYNRVEEVIAEAKAKGIDINSMKTLQEYIYDNMPDDRKKEMWETYGPTAKEANMSQEEFMALDDAEKKKIFVDEMGGARTTFGLRKPEKKIPPPPVPPGTPPNITPIPPPSTPPDEEWEEVEGTKFKVPPVAMSLGETSAIANVIGKGIQSPRESYLKLDRYNYASQLPKTLREIQLAEQAGRESARDIVAGDAGRYLSQSGNLSAARMKVANEAVIQDTLARQDILNKNVDLSNTELSTNRSLKDYYDDIKRQNINDFNALSIMGGQSIDESFDNYQKMRNENLIATQGLQLMADMSPNYTLIQNPDGTVRAVSRYRKKSSNSTPTPATSVKDTSINMFAPFNKMAQAGILSPQKSPNLNTSFQQMMQNPPQSGIPAFNATVLGQNSKLPRFGLPIPTIKEKGTKKAKTYKRK